MSNYSKSPNKFFGSIAGIAAGAARSGQVDFSALAGRSGLLGGAVRAAQARKVARVAGNVPSVVATAGASGMSGRIEGIESRLAALEEGSAAAGAAQPAEAAPVETQAQAAASQAMAADQTGNAVSGIGGIGIPVPPPTTAQADELGTLMASPFTMRQRSNMGPLTFKDQTGDGKITRADVIKARIEGYKK